MKGLIVSITLIVIASMALASMPDMSLPPARVYGTEVLENRSSRISEKPDELRHMSKKMYYLKSGRKIDSENNLEKQQNFWGEGVPSGVRFPSHLVEWEKFRRLGKAGIEVM